METSHLASKINVIKSDTNMTESIQKKISEISTNGLPKLVRLWQILIKSFEELKYAPNEEQAGSMAIIKLCYGSSLPDPSKFLEKITDQTNTQSDNEQTKISEVSDPQEKLSASHHLCLHYISERIKRKQTNLLTLSEASIPHKKLKLINRCMKHERYGEETKQYNHQNHTGTAGTAAGISETTL